jgi:sulfur-oxidizing protein SoxY
MEPDHYIKQIEVVLQNDPVPAKGAYRFTPQNGRAWVAFQMRSGAGGTLKAHIECSRHGKFVGERELRVVEGGCTAAPDKLARDRIGNPMLRVGRNVRLGEVVEVRAKVDHNSYTGLVLRGGRIVRERPEFFVKQVSVYLDRQLVSEFRLTSAVSPNPLFRFPLRVSRAGELRVVFVNSEGQTWEVSQTIQPGA